MRRPAPPKGENVVCAWGACCCAWRKAFWSKASFCAKRLSNEGTPMTRKAAKTARSCATTPISMPKFEMTLVRLHGLRSTEYDPAGTSTSVGLKSFWYSHERIEEVD